MNASASRWGLRALALVAALAVWFAASFTKREEQSEKVIDATVTYNAPRGIVILDPVQSVKVRLRGPDRVIRNLAPQVVDVVVAVTRTEPGPAEIPITADSILRPVGISVMAVDPPSIRLRLDKELARVLPVTPRFVGEPAGGFVPISPRVVPPNARVTGPESIVSGLSTVPTSPIDLEGHALSFTQTVSVVSPGPLVRVVDPFYVSVEVPMGVPGGGRDDSDDDASAREHAP